MSTQSQPDGNTTFSGLTGWIKQGVAAGIFVLMSWYLFFQVPSERESARQHGENMLKSVVDAYKGENAVRDNEIKAVFDRLLDMQSASNGLQKTNIEIQKKILTATKEGGMP